MKQNFELAFFPPQMYDLILLFVNMEFGHSVLNDINTEYSMNGEDKGTLCNRMYIWRHLATGIYIARIV